MSCPTRPARRWRRRRPTSPDIPPPLVTTVTDSTGKPIATLYDQYRLPINENQINEAMKWALVSVEDKRFYDHHGVDWQGTLRAAVSNSTGADTQGASTLTQQYVKNYLINVVYRGDQVGQKKAQEQSVARKLKEARIAIQLETKQTKQQILAGYLNIVEFSRQIYGVGAAAHAYFNTTPEKLTVPQAALLAGLVNNPINNDPWKHADKATARRNLVLDRMVENKKLAKADAERFKGEPLGVVPDFPAKPPANCIGAGPESGFFCQYVEDYLLKSGGMTKDQLYTGGYTIKSTLDERANHEAKVSAEAQVKKTQPYIANTLSLIKPGKDRHEVVALAANRDYGGDQDAGQTTYALPAGVYNTGGAGSTYKIFTSAAALEKGVAGIYSPVEHAGQLHLARVLDRQGRLQHLPATGQPAHLLVLRRERRRLQQDRPAARRSRRRSRPRRTPRSSSSKTGSAAPRRASTWPSGSACATRWRATTGGGRVDPNADEGRARSSARRSSTGPTGTARATARSPWASAR